ncbi:hypothetical protein M413DRAFT_28719 [Hebeloma cylindrosporum]|uniref:Uncharacterized protein n=1 Tax=Hebeloma cylindrosporum TaxID=76867 RepID=A0A0C3C7M9_HEBCY|nr:hypothetical protein M413DRAFT_28719 [Hebeloma cylindrosporum h7]
MTDMNAIIKVENKSTSQLDLLSLFTVLGEEPIVYPSNAGMSGESHFFLQYKSSQAAACACNLSIDFRDIRVLSLGQHPFLYHQYRLARQFSAASALPDHSREKVSLAGVKRDTAGSKHRTRRSPKANDPTWTCITPSPGTVAIQDRGAPESSICSTASDSLSSPVLQAPSAASVNELTSPSDKVDPTPSTGEILEQTGGHISPTVISEHNVRISALEDAPASVAPPISCETTVAVNLFGQSITYDLKADDSDPRVVIELLKASKSERTTYLTVAAFYRRSGNPQNAKHSPQTTEFAARGVGVDQLKPALLYLSGCEFELAKLAKAENKGPSIISEHYSAAQTWLQKVFGVQDPMRAQPQAKENQSIKEGPFKDVNNIQHSRAGDSSQGPSKPLPDWDIKRMERELRSLRSKNANQGKQLAQLNSLKRKLEDDYLYERDLRRKYQRQRDNLEEQLKSARKMEKHALEQITREVAVRRTAQETLVEMKTALGLVEGPKD